MRSSCENRSRTFVSTCQSKRANSLDPIVERSDFFRLFQVLIFNPNAMPDTTVDKVIRAENAACEHFKLRLTQSQRVKFIPSQKQITPIAWFVTELHDGQSRKRHIAFTNDDA